MRDPIAVDGDKPRISRSIVRACVSVCNSPLCEIIVIWVSRSNSMSWCPQILLKWSIARIPRPTRSRHPVPARARTARDDHTAAPLSWRDESNSSSWRLIQLKSISASWSLSQSASYQSMSVCFNVHCRLNVIGDFLLFSMFVCKIKSNILITQVSGN